MTTLHTEQRNPRSTQLDQLSVNEMVQLMNEEDATVCQAIQKQLSSITALIEETIKQLEKGGRLFYIGAGTSGRLGVLDAAECVPTFGTSPELVQGLIAGGEKALTVAVEGAEDSAEQAREDLIARQLSEKDMVIGIAASGRTPYVIGGLTYAQEIGASTGSIANNPEAKISQHAAYPVEVDTGPEVLTGSTRLKSGTAQKLVLNMISTVSMVRLGKAYENLMVDVQATNEKLVDRSKRIVVEATGVSYEEAEQTLSQTNGSVKLSILVLLSGATIEEAKHVLDQQKGHVRKAMNELT